MNKKLILTYAVALLALTACDTNVTNNTNTNGASNGTLMTTTSIASPIPAATASANEKSITSEIKGGIDRVNYKAGQTASVTFSGFPKTVNGFKQAQEKLGTTPEGAVLLELMAFEIYCHDKAAGKACLELANVDNNIQCVDRILKDRYNPKQGNYYTPQLVASYLEGATPMNGYKANKPFKINIRTSNSHKYEDSESLRGTVLYLEISSNGYDSNWRGISVVKQKGSPYYKVVNNPSMYTQCKPVSFKCDDEYVDVCAQ